MNKRDSKYGAAICAAQLLAASAALGNNIQVSSVTLQNIDSTADTAVVQFNLGWDNSWRVTTGPANHDAAWVFVKYHTGDLIWKTATLDVSDARHSVPSAATLDVGVNGTRGLGTFIYRSAPGSGDVAFNSIRLRWNYGADGVSDAALVTLDVHAIEMVYVPSGAFSVGDGVARTAATNAPSVSTFAAGAATPGSAPYTISAATTPVGQAAGSLAYTGLATGGTFAAVPASFPNGFNAYYVMKYEGSQGQWAAFLNSTSKLQALTYAFHEFIAPITPATVPPKNFISGRQVFFSDDNPPPVIQIGATPAPATPTRPMVKSKTPDRAFVGNEVATLAYLDWAGLRPMTEFEFEKVARGPVAPVSGEFAWGTADVALLSYGAPTSPSPALLYDGLANEFPAANYNESGGNAWVRGTQLSVPVATSPSIALILGPARVGMFAKPTYNPPTPPRIQSGSGYYGVMDLTGNVSELVARWTFPNATPAPVTFNAEHGDGTLGTNGQHDVAGWTPAQETYFALRGGSFSDQAAPVSVRSLLANGTLTNPGIRGVRTAPAAQ